MRWPPGCGTAAPAMPAPITKGLLAVDRDPVVSRLTAPARQALIAVADLAQAFAEAGRVVLAQERLGDGVHRDLAVIASKRSNQAATPMLRPVVLIPQVRSGAMAVAVNGTEP